MPRSLYAMLHRRFGPVITESERCARIEEKLELEHAQWEVAAPSRDCTAKLSDTTVAVVGGGFAGLSAAWSLCPEKVTVTVFEAHDELGGRVRTDKVFTKDRIVEAGAELIGANHPLWIESARHFGLGLNFVTREEDYERAGLQVKVWIDRLLSRDEAQKLYERMEKEVLKPFGQDATFINDPARPWLQPGLAKMDKMSVADKLTALKIKKTDILWKAMEVLLGNNNVSASLADQNYLALLCLVKGGMLPPDPELMGYWQSTETYRCADGNQTLAIKMAAELVATHKCKILLGTAVTDINLAKRITLKWQNIVTRKPEQGQFDYVILAVPPSVWPDLKITPYHPKDTIGLVQMGPAVKFLNNLRDRFWIKQGVAPLSWSTMIGQTWEGTDNQTFVPGQEIELSVFAGGRVHTESEFKKNLEKLFPGYLTKLKGTKLVDWPNEPFIKTGYASPKPGELFTIGKELNEPFQGRMFFAGEHTAMDFFGYMEGSLRSGARAAKALIDRVCGRPEAFVASRGVSKAPVAGAAAGRLKQTGFGGEAIVEEAVGRATSGGKSELPDLWHLPEVLSIEASKVNYPQSRLYYVETRPVLATEAVEIIVRTAKPFPVRAWSPAIFVGEVPVVEYETAGPKAYRFFAYDLKSLREGSSISLGWPQFPERRVQTPFVFRLEAPDLIASTLSVEDAPSCYDILKSTTGNLPTIGFEFDLSYGASSSCPPLKFDRSDTTWRNTVYSLIGDKITTHRYNTHGFRLEGDGNRIELATKPFELSTAGRSEMKKIMKDVLTLMKDCRDQCQNATPDDRGYPAAVGKPRHFKPGYLESGIKCIFPLGLSGKDPYYRETCSVAASPQATFELPLAKIDQLVTIIKDSEKLKVAGRALSGPEGLRQGLRSVVLYEAQKAVNRSREDFTKRKFKLPDGTEVTKANFSDTLQGLLVLMVSYLKSGLLTYGSKDYEGFAKAYLPLNVKTPFRLLHADLKADEKKVFKELYDNPRTNLWKLAKSTATTADKNNLLFPDFVESDQKAWFDPVPTWDRFVELTINNTPLKRNKSGRREDKEPVGCEVLFAPESHIIPYEPGSRRVIVEMRRLGFNWVFSHSFTSDKTGIEFPGWSEMTEMWFHELKLNK